MSVPAGGAPGRPTSSGYHRLRFRVLHESEDLLAAWLWGHGTVGIEFLNSAVPGRSELVATFEEEKLLVKDEFSELSAHLPDVEVLESGIIEDRDWLEAWRLAAKPIELGERLTVDPREWEPALDGSQSSAPVRTRDPRAGGATGERFSLQIPARTAFGVGSHESTRLAYELLEATPLAGRRVLDVGCGSGILAMAALLLGARAAIGFDFDPSAGLLAGQYARHNGLTPALFTGTVAAIASPASEAQRFEVVVLNVLPHEIREELGSVIDQLAEGGDLLVSGVLAVEAAGVQESIHRYGCEKSGEISAGEWVGLRFEKRRADSSAPPSRLR
ncbi:MAG: 50S ribosomal protein L11 methyltransferase [Thermoanaerobaculia bacterium]